METSATIVWRSLYLNGHEYCRVYFQNERWVLNGSAVFVRDNRPASLSYNIECNSEWETLRAKVCGRVGDEEIEVAIFALPDTTWTMAGVAQPNVLGCTDIDLNFSPSTNLLPIRRLKLEVGQEASVRAAWLRFPGFQLELLEQTYIRLSEDTYRYVSGGGAFSAELKVNMFGLVTHYPGIWEEQPG